MIAAKTKFLFEADFGPNANPAERPVAPAEHALKLAEAESRGFRDGYATAEKERAAEAERRTAAAFEQIADAIDRLARGLGEVEKRLEAEAVEVAVAVGRKLAPELIALEPFAEIAALATDCFKHLTASPHVVIAEPDIALGDCRIEWADGGVTRDRAATEAAIVDAVSRYLVATRGAILPELGETPR
jgi:flagellar assembly protein FliH